MLQSSLIMKVYNLLQTDLVITIIIIVILNVIVISYNALNDQVIGKTIDQY